MNLPKLSCVPSLNELRREMDRLFESYLGATPSDLIRGRGFPPVDVWEEGEALVVQAEVPGVSMDQIEVYARGSELTIKGSRPLASSGSTAVHRQEQQSGDFERTVTLPIEIDPDRIEATLKDGLLTVRVPKPPMSQARKVTVRATPPAPGAPA
jgi:HSP20 family protein